MFYFRLARELGYTVGRLLTEISSKEIMAWMAFLTVEDEIEQDKKRKASQAALKAHIEQMGRAAEKKKQREAKWRQRADSRSNGMPGKS